MSWESAKDIMLIGLCVSSAVAYDVFRPRLTLLVSAAMFLVVWELAGWNGLLSLITIAVGALAITAALAHRAITRRPFRTLPIEPTKEFFGALGLFLFWLVVGVVVFGET